LAVNIAFQIALALSHAHQRGVLHRDVKPSNIMITEKEVLLADFGLARPEWVAHLTASGTILGTPTYMSPEQIQGCRYLDGRSDIYSLGICLYEMLTGTLPFQGENLAELFHKILYIEPIPLDKIISKIPNILSYIVLKSIAKNPEERYQNAEEMAEELRCFLRELPIQSALDIRKKWYTRFQRMVQQHKPLLFFLTAFLITLTACSLYHNWKRDQIMRKILSQNSIRPPNTLYYILPKVGILPKKLPPGTDTEAPDKKD